MSAEGIFSEMIAHQSVQAIEALAHIDRFHRDVDPGRGTETEHLTSPRRPGSAAPLRLRRIRYAARCSGSVKIGASLPLAPALLVPSVPGVWRACHSVPVSNRR